MSKNTKTVKTPVARELTGLAAKHPEWQGKTANFRTDGELTKNQVRILQALSKKGRATFDKLVAASGNAKWPKLVRWALGKIASEGRCPFSLIARGLVKQTVINDDEVKDQVYEITGAGSKALAKANGK